MFLTSHFWLKPIFSIR